MVIWKERYARMMNIPLILLGSVLILITIMMAITFMIAGDFRRSLANIKVLIASGILGLLMITLGVLPWEIAVVVGIVVLAVGGFAFFLFIWLSSYAKEKLGEEVFKVREYIRREHIKPVLRFLIRTMIITGIILLFDMIGIGLWVFLFSQGLRNLLSFTELLAILLLLEGSLIGALGAFMFYGYSEYRLMGQAALWPTLASDQARRWRERRLSQQKWGIAMVIAGTLLILLGFLVSFLTAL